LSVLFGSILIYSLANIANGFVQSVEEYALARFIAGIGLAGELGAGITLVSELVSKEKRSKATSIVAGIGLTGAVAAYFVANIFDWRVCYFVGGGLGLALLLMRVSVFESGMYTSIQHSKVSKGNFFMFFTNSKRFSKYILAILIGLPTWYVIGILITFSKEFGAAFGITDVDPGRAVMLSYVAISIGDLLIGYISHELKSRKKALLVFYGFTILGIALYFSPYNSSLNSMYYICILMGFGTGFWALFVTMAAEHFGTNLRATAATTIPNFVRGSLPIMLLLFSYLEPALGKVQAGMATGILVMLISTLAVFFTEETFGKDLNFMEH
jgi:MFS family permease